MFTEYIHQYLTRDRHHAPFVIPKPSHTTDSKNSYLITSCILFTGIPPITKDVSTAVFGRMVYDWIHLVRPDLAQALLSSQVTTQITNFNCLISMEFNFALRLRLFIRVILFVSCIHESKFSLFHRTLVGLIYIKKFLYYFSILFIHPNFKTIPILSY